MLGAGVSSLMAGRKETQLQLGKEKVTDSLYNERIWR
jgi:hypothetical protein